MRTRRTLPALLAIGALGALAGPALAAPSATHITTPTDPAFITYPSSGAASLAVGGTSNGKTDKVDIRCDGTTGLLLKANVAPNAAGTFGTTISAATMAKLAGQSCILRAVPANHPSTSAHFAGPRVVVSDVRLITNKTGAVIDYRVRAPQINGRGVYSSAGSCGLQGSATFSASYTTSDDVFTCAARLAAPSARARRCRSTASTPTRHTLPPRSSLAARRSPASSRSPSRSAPIPQRATRRSASPR